jgi:hypothetical protein
MRSCGTGDPSEISEKVVGRATREEGNTRPTRQLPAESEGIRQ